MNLPYDPAIPLLAMYTKKKKALIWKDTCILQQCYLQMTKYGSNLCVHPHEWVKKKWYICITEYHSPIKNNRIFASGSNMDGLGRHYGQWNKTEKDQYSVISLICGI